MDKTVSIIIPVYNCEAYIKKALDSVLAQTYTNIEIVIVNDGSTDASPEICKSYAAENSNVKLINIQNQGLANARNVGLQNSSGGYILFLDGDDWYESRNTIEALMNCIKQESADVVCFNYKRFFEHSKTFSPPLLPIQDGISGKIELVKNNIFTSSAPLKFTSRKFLSDNNIHFEKGILSEDIEWSANVLKHANTIHYLGSCVYVYRLRQKSITTSISKKHVDDLIYVIEKLKSNEHTASVAYMSYAAFQYCTLLINAHIAKVDKQTLKKIYSMKDILQYNQNSIVRLVKIFSKVFGINLTAKALYCYFKAKAKVAT